MFKVMPKKPDTKEVNGLRMEISTEKLVYAVQYKKGYPFFTFYENGQWITRSAKYYEPIAEHHNTYKWKVNNVNVINS